MKKLLYLQASPRIERSYSTAAANEFVKAYKEKNPADQVITKNVFSMELPPFDGLAVQAKYTILQGGKNSHKELNAWKAVETVISEFKSADKYVLAVPMWNFGIPYRLKQYIDIIIQPGYTFSYSEKDGYRGLVTGKPVFIAYSRGGEYPPGTDAEIFDIQKKYLEIALSFIGLTDIRSVVIEPTLKGTNLAGMRKESAIQKAKKLAETF